MFYIASTQSLVPVDSNGVHDGERKVTQEVVKHHKGYDTHTTQEYFVRDAQLEHQNAVTGHLVGYGIDGILILLLTSAAFLIINLIIGHREKKAEREKMEN